VAPLVSVKSSKAGSLFSQGYTQNGGLSIAKLCTYRALSQCPSVVSGVAADTSRHRSVALEVSRLG